MGQGHSPVGRWGAGNLDTQWRGMGSSAPGLGEQWRPVMPRWELGHEPKARWCFTGARGGEGGRRVDGMTPILVQVAVTRRPAPLTPSRIRSSLSTAHTASHSPGHLPVVGTRTPQGMGRQMLRG